MSKTSLVILLSLIIVLSFGSCVPQAQLVYLQGQDEIVDSTRTFRYKKPSYRLQVNDIVDVQIRSNSSEVNSLFNLYNIESSQNQAAQANQSGDIFYLTGYSIDEDGSIELPVLGKIPIQGLTVPEAKLKIEEKVKIYFKDYFLRVKLGGIRFSALGEFNNPGKFNILQNQLTIFEAIAQAGDLTIVASRTNINLIRQYPDETRVHRVNLLDESIIESPFYFIQPNDVIYAEPLARKSSGIGITGAQTFTTVLTVVTSSVALILAIRGLN